MRARVLGGFLVAGAVMLAAERWLAAAPRPPVVVTRAQVDALRHALGAPEAAAVAAAVDEALLARAALDRGLDRDDPVVGRRLLQNMRVLGERGGGDAAALLRAAYALGMERTDPVVRRRLVERMRRLVEAEAAAEPPEAALRAWLAHHGAALAEPARVRVTHVFVATGSLADAARLRPRLGDPADAPALGDPFLLGHHLPPCAEPQLAARLGAAFARAAMSAPVGAWSAPVRSPWGAHLLWVHERTPARVPSFAEVRAHVREAVGAERRAQAMRETLAALRARYDVQVESAR